MQGERRQVTVLFADLAGYTALTNELDPEEILALLERFFDRVDWIVKEHGGHIDRHIGDCVMAIFGAPMAHGNDAERAIRAALAIREAIPELSARLGRPLGVHIGVAGGQGSACASSAGAVSRRIQPGGCGFVADRSAWHRQPCCSALERELRRRGLCPGDGSERHQPNRSALRREIGRASCRDRV